MHTSEHFCCTHRAILSSRRDRLLAKATQVASTPSRDELLEEDPRQERVVLTLVRTGAATPPSSKAKKVSQQKDEPSSSAVIFDTHATGSEDHPLIHAEGMTAEWWARTPPC